MKCNNRNCKDVNIKNTFQQDSASLHYGRDVCDYLETVFPDGIERKGTIDDQPEFDTS